MAHPWIEWTAALPKRGYAAWGCFFFEADALEPMRLFRISLGMLLFVAYFIRAVDSDFYFGSNGVLELDKMLEFFPMKYRWSFLIWFPGKAALWTCTGLLLVSLATMTLGVFPRLSALVAFLLHVSFMHRNMAIVYGLDMIAVFFLFYLIFAKTDSRPKSSNSWAALLTSSSLRMIQIQICVIYAYSGWEKLKGPLWWKGEAIWTVFANSQIVRWQLDWVSHFPLLVSFLTYMTLAWEIYFPALVWLKKWRPWLLVGGILLHIGIGSVVFIPFFAALMISSYATFLTPAEARWVMRRAVKIFRVGPKA